MTEILTIILTLVFLILGCFTGYLYANRKSQQQLEETLRKSDQEKEEILRELGQQKEETQRELSRQKEELHRESEQERKKTLEGSRSGIKGKVAENLALLMTDFQEKYPDLKISEARFSGEPIDYLFFQGIDDKNITKVVFLEVKSGKHPRLNETETSLKNVIDDAEHKGANVIWREYIVPETEMQVVQPPESERNSEVPSVTS